MGCARERKCVQSKSLEKYCTLLSAREAATVQERSPPTDMFKTAAPAHAAALVDPLARFFPRLAVPTALAKLAGGPVRRTRVAPTVEVHAVRA
mmetsp:Transcript_6389/g.39850  ORF Transcript_6389/g.39850 Transcript_6389/m.39850 type:complete len:93 (+) Transcript_6389:1738-2016(+)